MSEILDQPINEEESDFKVKSVIRWIGIVRLLFIVLLFSFLITAFRFISNVDLLDGDWFGSFLLISWLLIFSFSLIYNIPQMYSEIKLSSTIYKENKLRIFSMISASIVVINYGWEVIPLISEGVTFNINNFWSIISLLLIIFFIPFVILIFVQDLKYLRSIKSKN